MCPTPEEVRVSFVRCDPREAPASELLSEMAVELTALYDALDRLDHPGLDPVELLPPTGSYLVGRMTAPDGTEVVVAGGGVRLLALDGTGSQPRGAPGGTAAGAGEAAGVSGSKGGDRTAEIKRMFVRPAYRGLGVAAVLLGALEDTARALGYQAVRLDTGPRQPHALRLYEHAGYRRVPPYNDNPFAVFWGEKSL